MENKIIRLTDILISLIALLVMSPIIFIISLLTLVFHGRPIIYKQTRIGLKGRKFTMFKFRTMSLAKHKQDEMRLTLLGKILRKSSLDELPQFFNVIKKDMSIVGPRPLPKIIENKIRKSLKVKRRQVLPGITGMSQINYTGKNRRLIDKIYLDIKFIDNYTLNNYFIILLKTPIILIIRFFKNKSSIIK